VDIVAFAAESWQAQCPWVVSVVFRLPAERISIQLSLVATFNIIIIIINRFV